MDMFTLRHRIRRRTVLTRLLLGLLLVRAYVPVGFMPQGGSPLQLQICSARTSTSLPATPARGTGTSGNLVHDVDCPFNHSPAAGPIPDLPIDAAIKPASLRALLRFDTRPSGVRVLRAHQARAPPSLA
jgi:hypothetical protein